MFCRYRQLIPLQQQQKAPESTSGVPFSLPSGLKTLAYRQRLPRSRTTRHHTVIISPHFRHEGQIRDPSSARVLPRNHNQAITCGVAAQDVKDLFRLRRVQFTDWQQMLGQLNRPMRSRNSARLLDKRRVCTSGKTLSGPLAIIQHSLTRAGKCVVGKACKIDDRQDLCSQV